MSQKETIDKTVWTLKRYGRFLPRAKDSESNSSWKEGFSLLNARSFLKIHQKSDSLLFHMTLKGESRMMRLQFNGSNRSEAVDLCRKAVERIQEYLPEHPAPPPSTHATQIEPCDLQKQTPIDTLQAVPDVTQESLTIKHLSQHFLGLHGLSLPLAYHHCTVPPGGMEALLRLCLLDSSFPAFVEEVENKLKELIQE